MRVAAAVLCLLLLTAEIPLAERRSGYEFMGRDTRAMQDDDSTNPALFWLMDGETLWKRKDGVAACSSCHETMKGVAARYPKVAGGRAVNLEQQINSCRSERQKAAPFAYESRELLALTAYVAR